MLKSCQYCQKIHDSKYNCGMKPPKMNRRSKYDRFRYTSAWQQKREEIKKRDRYLCQICIRNLYDTTRKFNGNDLSVHHANKLNDAFEQRLDNNNLLTLCEKHHKMADDGVIPKEQILSIIHEQNIHPPREALMEKFLTLHTYGPHSYIIYSQNKFLKIKREEESG